MGFKEGIRPFHGSQKLTWAGTGLSPKSIVAADVLFLNMPSVSGGFDPWPGDYKKARTLTPEGSKDKTLGDKQLQIVYHSTVQGVMSLAAGSQGITMGTDIIPAHPVFQGEADGAQHDFVSKKGPLYMQVGVHIWRWTTGTDGKVSPPTRLSLAHDAHPAQHRYLVVYL